MLELVPFEEALHRLGYDETQTSAYGIDRDIYESIRSRPYYGLPEKDGDYLVSGYWIPKYLFIEAPTITTQDIRDCMESFDRHSSNKSYRSYRMGYIDALKKERSK